MRSDDKLADVDLLRDDKRADRDISHFSLLIANFLIVYA
jgi:hypothetical protein